VSIHVPKEDVIPVDLWVLWAEGIRTLRAWHVWKAMTGQLRDLQDKVNRSGG
jgi:hypothetical protein